MSALPKPDTLFVTGPSKPTADSLEGGDFAITDGGTNILAEVFYRVSVDRTQDAEAIATLFAAAPELLEIVRITIGNVRSLGPAGALGPVDRPYRIWLARLEEAYFNATGSRT